MRIIDLSHNIQSDMPIYPGDESPHLKKVATIENEGYRETEITIYSHTGTHIDAPCHMLKNGLFLDDLEVSHFYGRATLINIPDEINRDTVKCCGWISSHPLEH